MPQYVEGFKPIGAQVDATISTTVVTLEAPSGPANAVMIQNLDASDDLRYTLDGSAPTSSHGFILYHSVAATPEPGAKVFYLPYGKQLKLLRAASADVTITYQYGRIGNFPS